mmetsp:Transcript_53411/g.79376  ORF Transcript_53411/g.79376 Transcript_53411/m.79376 type:complete len:914 (+) Transcript_53411:39-2780(+)|eukprot:CAMPEP_0195530952 /NCGR_PEP_ID=MMETSP0794_2-20130614/34082_1 /TAXON_ID=515487 /ORGANISM="Stephanopyxis turris, Strain CCMP 815" /LENGTH=913 /DNA_ID=CAMNT_0040662577 /DNA_START=39 /DNA_END=2780 /DNA_ORIENTATION=+
MSEARLGTTAVHNPSLANQKSDGVQHTIQDVQSKIQARKNKLAQLGNSRSGANLNNAAHLSYSEILARSRLSREQLSCDNSRCQEAVSDIQGRMNAEWALSRGTRPVSVHETLSEYMSGTRSRSNMRNQEASGDSHSQRNMEWDLSKGDNASSHGEMLSEYVQGRLNANSNIPRRSKPVSVHEKLSDLLAEKRSRSNLRSQETSNDSPGQMNAEWNLSRESRPVSVHEKISEFMSEKRSRSNFRGQEASNNSQGQMNAEWSMSRKPRPVSVHEALSQYMSETRSRINLRNHEPSGDSRKQNAELSLSRGTRGGSAREALSQFMVERGSRSNLRSQEIGGNNNGQRNKEWNLPAGALAKGVRPSLFKKFLNPVAKDGYSGDVEAEIAKEVVRNVHGSGLSTRNEKKAGKNTLLNSFARELKPADNNAEKEVDEIFEHVSRTLESSGSRGNTQAAMSEKQNRLIGKSMSDCSLFNRARASRIRGGNTDQESVNAEWNLTRPSSNTLSNKIMNMLPVGNENEDECGATQETCNFGKDYSSKACQGKCDEPELNGTGQDHLAVLTDFFDSASDNEDYQNALGIINSIRKARSSSNVQADTGGQQVRSISETRRRVTSERSLCRPWASRRSRGSGLTLNAVGEVPETENTGANAEWNLRRRTGGTKPSGPNPSGPKANPFLKFLSVDNMPPITDKYDDNTHPYEDAVRTRYNETVNEFPKSENDRDVNLLVPFGLGNGDGSRNEGEPRAYCNREQRILKNRLSKSEHLITQKQSEAEVGSPLIEKTGERSVSKNDDSPPSDPKLLQQFMINKMTMIPTGGDSSNEKNMNDMCFSGILTVTGVQNKTGSPEEVVNEPSSNSGSPTTNDVSEFDELGDASRSSLCNASLEVFSEIVSEDECEDGDDVNPKKHVIQSANTR